MFDREAARLREILLGQRAVSPLLNLGSSTRAFREVAKPHIHDELFGPLKRPGSGSSTATSSRRTASTLPATSAIPRSGPSFARGSSDACSAPTCSNMSSTAP
jgi:hypothetical protein